MYRNKKGKKIKANPCKEPPCGDGDMEEIKDLVKKYSQLLCESKNCEKIISKDGMFCCLSQSFL